MIRKIRPHRISVKNGLEELNGKAKEIGASTGVHDLNDSFEKEMDSGLEQLAKTRFGDPDNLDALKKEQERLEEDHQRISKALEEPLSPPRKSRKWSWRSALSIFLGSALIGLGLEYLTTVELHWQGWTLLGIVTAALILHTETLPAFVARSVSGIKYRARKMILGRRRRSIESRMDRLRKQAGQVRYQREQISTWISSNRDGLMAVYGRYKEMGLRAR